MSTADVAATDADEEERWDDQANGHLGPSPWDKLVSQYKSTVSKVGTAVRESKVGMAVRDLLGLVKAGGSESNPKGTSKEMGGDVVAKHVDRAGDATAMRRHERTLELLHAGSEMGYPVAMVCCA